MSDPSHPEQYRSKDCQCAAEKVEQVSAGAAGGGEWRTRFVTINQNILCLCIRNREYSEYLRIVLPDTIPVFIQQIYFHIVADFKPGIILQSNISVRECCFLNQVESFWQIGKSKCSV